MAANTRFSYRGARLPNGALGHPGPGSGQTSEAGKERSLERLQWRATGSRVDEEDGARLRPRQWGQADTCGFKISEAETVGVRMRPRGVTGHQPEGHKEHRDLDVSPVAPRRGRPQSDDRIHSWWKQPVSQTPTSRENRATSRENGESSCRTMLLTMPEMKVSTEPQKALNAQQAPSSVL